MRVRARSAVLIAVLLAGAQGLAASADEGQGYSFAVVPQGPPEKMRAVWLPVVERLAADARVPLQLRLYARAEDFEADVAAGKLDLAYVNPVQAIRGHRAAGYRPLVRDAATLRGVFLAAADSPFTTVESLAGHEVAFIAPWTFCSQTLRAYTRELGMVPRFVGTAANVEKGVLLGLYPAGGLLDTSLDEAPAEVRSKLRVIYTTPPMAPHAVVAHPRVPHEVSERVSAALLALAHGDGAPLLAAVHLPHPVEAAYARDYAALEQVIDGTRTGGAPERRVR